MAPESKEVGAMMGQIIRAEVGRYCDYCKGRWGKLKDGSLHEKARRQAVVVVISTITKSKGIERAYCETCRAENSRWADGSVWPISDQLNYAKAAYGE
jgi:hypothetical protein